MFYINILPHFVIYLHICYLDNLQTCILSSISVTEFSVWTFIHVHLLSQTLHWQVLVTSAICGIDFSHAYTICFRSEEDATL
jgi:hypothetical protein